MGLINWITTQVTGIDPAAEQARGQAADAAMAQSNADLFNAGTWSQSQYDAAMANLSATATGDVQSQIDQAAEEGAIEGVNNLVKTVADTAQGLTNWTFGSVFKLIPWQVWPILVIVAFFYLGGGVLLKGLLARKLK
jgi:hypothetical protein